jgi:hypothetical protein
MKYHFLLAITLFLTLVSCNSSNNSSGQTNNELSPKKEGLDNNTTPESKNVDDPNSSPESVMETIFNSAKSGEVGVLKFLLPPNDECDGDCKALCNPGNERMRDELRGNYITLENYKYSFSKAKIIGSPNLNGEEANVNFVFGPNLERNETMNLQKINGKWYLKSF